MHMAASWFRPELGLIAYKVAARSFTPLAGSPPIVTAECPTHLVWRRARRPQGRCASLRGGLRPSLPPVWRGALPMSGRDGETSDQPN